MIAPTSEEKFIRLPEPGESCPHCSLTREELELLIFPRPENGNDPAIRYKSIAAPGKPPVILIPWISLQAFILKQDPRRSYETPRSFYRWISRYPSSHADEVPSEVIQITNLYQHGEEPQFDAAVNEQLSMNRSVFIIYTRKGAAVGYRKTSKIKN